MCLYTIWNKPRIAVRDMECYKVVLMPDFNRTYVNRLANNPRGFKSIHYQHDWYIGSTYKEERFQDKPDGFAAVNFGFHSYIPLQYAINGCNYTYRKAVLKCIIPKGTRYYRSEGCTEYCSEMIKVVGWRYFDERKWRDS